MLFDWRKMVEALVEEQKKKTPIGCLAARFMNTLIQMAVMQCEATREETGLSRVVLSGGTFQNRYLLERLPEHLREVGFNVYHHRRVSCNDEGLSLGQAVIALYRLGKGKNVSGCST